MHIIYRLPFPFLVFAAGVANAQWAVSDNDVLKELQKINAIAGIGEDIDQSFKNSRSGTGDVTIGVGGEQAVLKSVDTKFEDLVIPPAEAEKYILTSQDCGSKESNEKHYKACVGLRNLRLQTLKQGYDMVKTLDKRRAQIRQLIKNAQQIQSTGGVGGGIGGGVGGGAGQQGEGAGKLQRYQFELQALQALMQADAMQLGILMDGYKQREQAYTMQMVEAKRANDTGAFDSEKGIVKKKALPFVMP